MGAAHRLDEPQRIAIPAPADHLLLRAHEVGADYEVDAVPLVLIEVSNLHDIGELRDVVGVGLNGDVSGDPDSALQTPTGQVVGAEGALYPNVQAWIESLKERDRRYAERAAARAAQRAAEALA